MNLRCIYFYFILTILWTCVACQTAAPKPDNFPTTQPSARPLLRSAPTQTPRPIAATLPPPLSPTASQSPPVSMDSTASPVVTLPPLKPPVSAIASVTPATPTIIGYSAGGLPLTVQSFGSGAHILLLIGGIHGGWEANTVALMQQLSDHFTSTPGDILPSITVMIVPIANPDGLAYGRIPRGRFNADGVDLNRNWSCEWSRDAFWRQDRVNPGVTSFSEPESVALANFLLQTRPAVALFYHSAANGVFAGNCGGDHGSAAMSAVYGKAAGYGYDAPFTAYSVTGVASNWADGQGIPAADIELQTSTDSEYDRNLRGIMTLQQWIVAEK